MSERPIDAQHEMKRGLWWMGGATVAMRALDLLGTLFVLQLLTKLEVGLATTTWTWAVVVEAFNGLGVGTVVVRQRDLTHHELSGLFWFSTLLGVSASLALSAGAPWLARFYSQPELAPMFVVSAAKLAFVGASLVPLQVLVRELRFREAGAAQLLASLGEAVTKVVLILAGFGAWGLVMANAARGLCLFLGLLWLAPFRPRLTLAAASTLRSVRFGIKVAASSILYSAYRNADFLLVGRVLGQEVLGLYRVAFDIGMAPLEAVLNVVNRVQFPIYARLQHEGEKLRDAFFGSARSLLLVVGPIAVLLTFASGDFLRLFSHGQWLPALPMVQVAVWASLLRGLGLLFPQLYHATGRPEYALYDSLVTGGTLVTGFVLALVLAPAGNGALWVAWAWLLSCPVALAVDFALVRRCAPITLTGLFRSLRRPAAGVALLVPVLALARFLRPTNGSPLISLLLLILLGLGTYALYLRRVLHLRPADLLPKR